MTSLLLIDELVRVLEKLFAGYGLINSSGQYQSIKIFAQYLPRPKGPEISDDADTTASEEAITLGRPLDDYEVVNEYSQDEYYSRMPCIVVKMEAQQDREENNASSCQIKILTACLEDYDVKSGTFTEESRGWRDVLNVQERIRTELLKNRIIGEKFLLMPPLKSRLVDVETWPVYFGEMEMNFEVFRPTMRDYIYRPKRK